MGGVLALDMGLVYLRICILDRRNELRISDRINQEGFLMLEHSFHSEKHGGVFHQIQFNVLIMNQVRLV